MTEIREDKALELDTTLSDLEKAKQELAKIQMEIERRKEEIPLRKLDADEEFLRDKQITSINEMKSAQALIARQKEYDDKPITGKFINRRAPGNQVKLTYLKYDTDPVKWWTFQDGKVYTIPRGFVDQINEYYYAPVFTQKDGPSDPNQPSSVIQEVDTSNKKYAFVPIGFAA